MAASEIPSVTKKIVAFGSKAIYLPKFTIALMRTPNLSPYHARFEVPLNFSKFDLRDYLYHAYNVKVFNVRSAVRQQPVRSEPGRRLLYRPDAKKYMTVEMEKPFVWPELPKDMAPWGHQEKEYQDRMVREMLKGKRPGERREEAANLREQAKALLRKRAPEPEAGKEEKVKDTEEEEIQHLEPVERWERTRTVKIVKGDEGPFLVKV
ncbi:hypothetical protein BS50DRAFT_579749 [Corynespora cassiicola Philippines]|uniref:Large ribosomal subunit protein uL23m n=1 Tax=Corynespora cassiicola Philippines TaxID=1448308 RepID=A0A2T2N3W9_CORCC|nr:hypothetical protein BS50DRAFT_579749 [Corynespora cassiicola Philippines]